ncbi:cytochrome-c oxidase, cbb3-type subunit III [Cardiobacterium hominis]|uniref:Cytochrome c oxidase subunit III n=1 Tax=Cardiobacterium hominis TaxID=2718 RepID=A0A1C3H2V5_9GAMM|nr:cytochrome-c oxidase, cbb3-type subunit III [Cardiobacterium hominis]SAM59856.1 Cytochrome c oxidase subunit CcoP [Cardiobacterium hominis]
MTAVSIFIAAVTILHILGYIGLVYWTTHIKAGGDAKEGEVIDHTWDGDLKEMNNPMPGWWLSLFYLMIAFAIAYLFLYPGVYKGSKGWTQLTQYQQESRRVDARSAEYFRHYAGKSVEDLAKDTDALAIGRRIFLQNCAVCHASDAGGTPGNYPNLTDKDWIWGGTPENIINTITNGHTGAMPAGGALISVTPGQAPSAEDQQKLEDVSNYILALGGYEHDQALAEKGKELYGTSCVACHGPDGKGNPIIGGINLADQTWLYAEDSEDPAALKTFIQNQIQHPRNNVMPAWKDILGEAKIKVVAAYVYSLSQDESEVDNSAEEEKTATPAAAGEVEKPAAEATATAAETTATTSAAEKPAAEATATAAETTATTSAAEKPAAETTATTAEAAATTSAAEKPAAETTATAAEAATTTSAAEKPAAEAVPSAAESVQPASETAKPAEAATPASSEAATAP